VGFEFIAFVVIGPDCIGSYKSNYHTITTMKAPLTFVFTKLNMLYITINL
jgi:hypothetical protein